MRLSASTNGFMLSSEDGHKPLTRHMQEEQKLARLHRLKYWPRIFLGLSLLSFAVGSMHGHNVVVYLGKPMAAIFFILYMMFMLFQREVTDFDAEQQRKLGAIEPTIHRETSEPSLRQAESRRPGIGTFFRNVFRIALGTPWHFFRQRSARGL